MVVVAAAAVEMFVLIVVVDNAAVVAVIVYIVQNILMVMMTMIAAVMMMMMMMTIRMVSGDTSFPNYGFFYLLLLDFFLNFYMFISNEMTMTMRYVEMKDLGNHNTRNAKKIT